MRLDRINGKIKYENVNFSYKEGEKIIYGYNYTRQGKRNN